MTERLLSTAKVCELLDVSRWTLRRWESSGELVPVKTKGGHRRFKESEVLRLMGVALNTSDNLEVVAVYTRVSSHEQKQKGDLDRQKARLLEHCIKRKYNVEHIFTEVGSGMNDNRSFVKATFSSGVFSPN